MNFRKVLAVNLYNGRIASKIVVLKVDHGGYNVKTTFTAPTAGKRDRQKHAQSY